MNRIFLCCCLVLFSIGIQAQKINEQNTDSLYFKGLELYQNQQFKRSLEYADKGLLLAPEYHDIRILRVRNFWALEMLDNASSDLQFLLEKAPEYPGVRELVIRQAKLLKDPESALSFLSKLEERDTLSANLKILKAELLLQNKDKAASRKIALELFNNSELDKNKRYTLQNILKRTISNEIGVNYQYIHFSDDYNRDNWQTISPEFLHYFNRTAVIARVNYTDRGFDQGTLYELESYPVFSDRVYAFLNLGISDGNLYPDLRTSASIFVNIFEIFELETGARLLHFSNEDYFSGIIGLTMYTGKFYLNSRVFLGPEINDQLTQNYQFNLRYYLNNTDNFLFLRLGTGISPDESTIFTQVQENPALEAYYSNLGINFTIGPRHIFQVGAGYLFEEVTSNRDGNQIIGNIGYRFRF
ncbi:YaiO family outer membrane beta-barrel protein [Christiangramia sediminis]|uniref:YaiO family outer membrane beta-barrel protein n=1 Tax=Christiangramia sediminis TaxID=2881336 RepID=A0A9X1LGE2_9FLAO|nr:YaiO family outer membrane beta-barrel protein [Christiangramia sediminis]MCB7479804.1 YaiO family outer membrane beta-barrel protein [Christiangramia sediminis]